MVREVDYNPKPIDENFLNDPEHYPVTGTHNGHEVRAEGIQRYDSDGKPYPTKNGIHGTHVAVDWETCVADGSCMDVCPVGVYEWALNVGKMGTDNDKDIRNDPELYAKYRTDKADPVREADCIFCFLCENACPVKAIKITP